MDFVGVLRELMVLDDKILQLSDIVSNELPKKLEEPIFNLNKARNTLELTKKHYAQVLAHYKGAEEQKETVVKKLAVLQESLRQNTGAEYQKILREQSKLKKMATLNDRRLETALSKLESTKKALDEKQALYDKFAEAYEDVFISVKDKIRELEEELDILRTKRKALLNSLDDDVKKKYLDSYKTGKERAVSLLIDNRCSVCHMTLPPNVINRVLRAEELELCPNCGRIILLDKDSINGISVGN